MEPTCEIDEIGNKEWRLNDKFHREDGPAVEYANGTKFWCLNGRYYREDGPAVEWASGRREWYLNGIRHRDDGPAVINRLVGGGGGATNDDGDEYWYRNGLCHREDGPAVKRDNGIIEWWLNNRLVSVGERPENWNELVLLAQVEQVMND